MLLAIVFRFTKDESTMRNIQYSVMSRLGSIWLQLYCRLNEEIPSPKDKRWQNVLYPRSSVPVLVEQTGYIHVL